jgi:hypothetical protein
MSKMTICVKWTENGLLVARVVDSEEEAAALAAEKERHPRSLADNHKRRRQGLWR